MANDYYGVSTDFVPATKVRSGDLDSEFAAIEAGFDKLAGSDALNSGSIVHGNDTGTVDAPTVDNGGTNTYVEGQQVTFMPAVTNTGATTLTVNLGTAESIRRNDGTLLQAGDLIAGVPVLVIWSGTDWVLVGATAQQTREFVRAGISYQSGELYTVTTADETKVIIYTNASAISVTMPSNSDDPLPIGHICHHYQGGAGRVQLVPAAGVTLNYAIGLSTRTLHSALSTIKIAANEYNVVGDQI